MPRPKRQSDIPVGATPPLDLDEVAVSIVNPKLETGNVNMFTPIPTGFETLDAQMGGGLHGGDLILLGGVQNIGKTAMVMQIASHAAMCGAMSIVVCFEHSAQALWERLLIQQSYAADPGEYLRADDIRNSYIGVINDRMSSKTGNDYINQFVGKLPNGARAWANLSKIHHSLWLVTGDSRYTSLDVLEAYINMAKEYNERVLLLVDYVQRVPMFDLHRYISADEKTERVIQGLKSLALKKTNEGMVVPVMGVATADAEGLRGGRIHMENLSGSSYSQYEPDQGIIMNKDIDFAEDGSKIVRFALEKNRRGPSDIEFRHKYIGSAYTFEKEGELVSEEMSWQKERKLLREQIAALYSGSASEAKASL